jgi:hypothetical protein
MCALKGFCSHFFPLGHRSAERSGQGKGRWGGMFQNPLIRLSGTVSHRGRRCNLLWIVQCFYSKICEQNWVRIQFMSIWGTIKHPAERLEKIPAGFEPVGFWFPNRFSGVKQCSKLRGRSLASRDPGTLRGHKSHCLRNRFDCKLSRRNSTWATVLFPTQYRVPTFESEARCLKTLSCFLKRTKKY